MLTNNEGINVDIAKSLLQLGDIINPKRVNLVNGSVTDLLTTYDIAKGSANFTYQIPLRSSFSIQCSVSDLTGILDATLDIYGSNDSKNWASITPITYSRITLSATPDTHGWVKDITNYDFIKVTLTKNNCTGGNLTLLMVLK